MKPIYDIILDYECLKPSEDGVLIELGAVAFENDMNVVPDYNELVSSGFRCKFLWKEQKDRRSISKDTLEWWKEQSDEARQIFIEDGTSVTLAEGHQMFFDWLEEVGYSGRSHVYCRGNFDFGAIQNVVETEGLKHAIAEKFWKFRDVRTRIEADMGVRDMCKAPLRKGLLPGFIHHNGIHDCAKDAMMVIMAQRYAHGLEEMPKSVDECEEVSV